MLLTGVILCVTYNLHTDITRRSLVSTTLISSVPPNAPEPNSPIDWYAHWSFFGLAPPPIEERVTYENLVKMSQNNEIYSIQIATQHDCLIATTNIGHRLALLIKDEDVPLFITDVMNRDKIPFKILPLDVSRKIVRQSSILILWSYIAFVGMDILGFVPWDTTPYSSISERKNITEKGMQVPSLKNRLKQHINNFFNTTNTNDTKINE